MIKEIPIPSLGATTEVDLVQILVKQGDAIQKDDPICVVESEKSSFDIISPDSGIVHSIHKSVGQKIQAGDIILSLVCTQEQSNNVQNISSEPLKSNAEKIIPKQEIKDFSSAIQAATTGTSQSLKTIYASPLVRKLARQNKVSLELVTGSGLHGRITLEDFKHFISSDDTNKSAYPVLDSLPDYQHWGSVRQESLSRIKKLAAKKFTQNWTSIPHVTHFDVALVQQIEDYRHNLNQDRSIGQTKYTLLTFVIKALSQALKEFPIFNSSLSSCGQYLLFKPNVHIGIAVETEKGLLVPVMRHADQISLSAIKESIAILAQKARSGVLQPEEYQGHTFTVSSLGSHGGRFFTPLIQWPDVAILGVCKTYEEPCIVKGMLQSRLCLPLSLSYDHRVIDGGLAARFMTRLLDLLNSVDHFQDHYM